MNPTLEEQFKDIPLPDAHQVVGVEFAEGVEYPEGTINPSKLSDEEFSSLVARIRAGEVRALKARARVFIDAPNKNLTRPKPGQLAAIAKKAAGALFLYDHNGYSSRARIGTVTAGEVVDFEGNDALVLEWDIVDPEAQERYVRGQMDRFSVGIGAESAECSVCGAEAERGWFRYFLDCGHEVGESYPSTETGERVLCEVFLVNADLREVSTVNFPAVPNTAVLSELRLSGLNHHHEGATPDQPTEDAMSDENKTDESAAYQEEIARLKEEREAADALLFDALFDRAVAEGKALPREKDDQKDIFSALGRDKFQSMLANRPAIAGFSNETLGESSASPADQEPEEDVLALARHSRRIRRSNLTEAKLQEIGFNELRIVE